jgi:hypothetical protein
MEVTTPLPREAGGAFPCDVIDLSFVRIGALRTKPRTATVETSLCWSSLIEAPRNSVECMSCDCGLPEAGEHLPPIGQRPDAAS